MRRTEALGNCIKGITKDRLTKRAHFRNTFFLLYSETAKHAANYLLNNLGLYGEFIKGLMDPLIHDPVKDLIFEAMQGQDIIRTSSVSPRALEETRTQFRTTLDQVFKESKILANHNKNLDDLIFEAEEIRSSTPKELDDFASNYYYRRWLEFQRMCRSKPSEVSDLHHVLFDNLSTHLTKDISRDLDKAMTLKSKITILNEYFSKVESCRGLLRRR